jgi:CHAT domain-containing protein
MYDSASFFYGRAMETLLELYGGHHPLVAQTCRSMARLAEKQGRFEEALSLAQRAVMAVAPDLADSSYMADPALSDSISEMDLFEAMSYKAGLLERYFLITQKREILERSLAGYERVAELIERMRFSYRAEGSKLFLGKKAKNEYENAIRVCHRLYQLTGELIYAEKAFEFSEKSKAGVLLEAMFDADARKFAGIPDSLLAKEKDIRLKLSLYDTQIEKEAGNKRKDTLKIREYENRVFSLRSEYDRLIRSLEYDYPNYFRLKYRPHPVTMAAVREQLGGATLVEYFTGDSALFIFTLNASQFAFRSFPKDTAFESVVAGVRRSVTDLNFKQYPPAAYRAYRWLIAPVTQELKSGGRIIVIPDGVLNYLPFDMLLTKEVNFLKGIDFTQLPYLIRNFTISYTYSAGLITSQNKKESGGFLGFAPVFSDSLTGGYVKKSAADTTMRDVTMLGTRFAELPYTEKEVNGILRSFEKNGLGGQIYVKDRAGEESFKSAVSENFRFIHVASHGFINESNPKLSGIIFSQKDSVSPDDGILYAGEIYGLKLDAELVTLSACKSGIGKVVKGEGIMGLTRGFIYSGAKNVLVSLWQLGDESTSELMIQFYEYVLTGNDLSTALRKAKLDFIRDKKYAYPADWGGFVLIGR